MKKIISVIGARPQFIKHAPMQLALQKKFKSVTIHTGQHYDENMSNVFFNELQISKPDYLFDIGGSKPQGEQTAIMMTEIEKVCLFENPDALLIYGDTNSTLAGCLVAAKLNIKIIHIEAGLRSFNRSMPEEVNRIVADIFSFLLFCPTISAVDNLKKEGISHDRVFVTGDVMCDMLELVSPQAKKILKEEYYFATIHRPYNTDESKRIKLILENLNGLDHKVILPMHPRTLARMKSFDIRIDDLKNLQIIEPVGYIESISYQKFANCIITDSGGIQKEAYMLGVKCITLRSETEWTETLNGGWNTLVFDNINDLKNVIKASVSNYQQNLYGDGHAAEAIVDIISEQLDYQ